MKRNAIARIILYAIAILVLSGILLAGLGVGMYMVSGSSHEVTHSAEKLDEVSYSADPNVIEDIQIDWVTGSVTIIPSDQDNITVAETADADNKHKMVIKESGNKLIIEYAEDSVFVVGINQNDFEAKDLAIYVPMDWTCDSLEIDAVSAGLEVSDMVIREVEFDGASGICNFTNCQVGTLSVDTASGDVTFSGILDEADFDGMSACFTAVLSNVPSRLDMDTMSGDLDVTLPEDCGFTLNLDAMSSDFTSDFATTMQNGSHICGDGSCRINVTAMSGEIAIHKHSASGHREDTHH